MPHFGAFVSGFVKGGQGHRSARAPQPVNRARQQRQIVGAGHSPRGEQRVNRFTHCQPRRLGKVEIIQ